MAAPRASAGAQSAWLRHGVSRAHRRAPEAAQRAAAARRRPVGRSRCALRRAGRPIRAPERATLMPPSWRDAPQPLPLPLAMAHAVPTTLLAPRLAQRPHAPRRARVVCATASTKRVETAPLPAAPRHALLAAATAFASASAGAAFAAVEMVRSSRSSVPLASCPIAAASAPALTRAAFNRRRFRSLSLWT